MAKKEQNIFSKVMQARLQFLESNPQKSGRNEFQKFSYYELDDIVPTATRICNDLSLYTEIDLGANVFGYATMTVVNIDNPEEKVYFRIRMPEINNENMNKALQETGSCQTYLRRYLYLQFLDIAQNDEVDSKDSRPTKTNHTTKPPSVEKPRNKPAPAKGRLTLKQKNEIKKIDERLESIAKNPNLTEKSLMEKIDKLEKNGMITTEEKTNITEQIKNII